MRAKYELHSLRKLHSVEFVFFWYLLDDTYTPNQNKYIFVYIVSLLNKNEHEKKWVVAIP